MGKSKREKDPKQVLHQFLSTYIQRPICKTDIFYETIMTQGGYQTTVALPCLKAEAVFVGEVTPTPKDAEKSAIRCALAAHADDIKVLGPSNKQLKKKMRSQYKHSSDKNEDGLEIAELEPEENE